MYRPRQRRLDRKWEYVVTDDRSNLTYPVGYCVGIPDLESPDLIQSLGSKLTPAYIFYRDVVERHISMYHEDGHDTLESAAACFRSYLLGNRLNLNVRLEYPMNCVMCGNTTTTAAVIDTTALNLCNTHRNAESVDSIFPTLIDGWES